MFYVIQSDDKSKCVRIIFVGILQVLKFEFLKFRILEIWNFHPCSIFDCQFQRVQRCLLVFEEAPHWYELRYVNIVLSMIVNSREYRDVYWCLRKHLTDLSWDMLILYYLWLSIPESTEMSTGVWGSMVWVEIC